jgi:hypothetical protein
MAIGTHDYTIWSQTMRSFVVGLLTLTTMISASRTSDAQLIHIGDISPQPMFVPMTNFGAMSNFNAMPLGYSGYSMQSVNQRAYDNMLMTNLMLMSNNSNNNDFASRSASNARGAEFLTLLPFILELFPDLKIPGLDINNTSQLDEIEKKIDKLLAEQGIDSDDNTGDTADDSTSGLANLIREILGLLRPNQQAVRSGRAPRSNSMADTLPLAKRQRLVKELETMLEEMSNEGGSATAGDRLEAAVDKAEEAIRQANDELIRAEGAQQIEEIRRQTEERLRKNAGQTKQLSLAERIKAQRSRLNSLNRSTKTKPTAKDDAKDEPKKEGTLEVAPRSKQKPR